VSFVQAYQTSQYVVSRGSIFLCKWRNSFAGSSDGKMKVQSACPLNTQYNLQFISVIQLRATSIKELKECCINRLISLTFNIAKALRIFDNY
jgi:hypothetical protein